MNTPAEPNLPPWPDRHIWQIKAFRDLLWILALVGIISFGYYLRSIFLPVLLSLALAYLFNPLINYAENRFKVSRPMSISILLMIISLSILGFLAWLAPLLIGQTISLISKIPAYVQQIPVMDDSYVTQNEILSSIDAEGNGVQIASATPVINEAVDIADALVSDSTAAAGSIASPSGATGTVVSATGSVSSATGFASTPLGTSWLQVRDRLQDVLSEYGIDVREHEQQLIDRARENMGDILQFTYNSVISFFRGTGSVVGAFTSIFGDVFGTLTYFTIQLALMPIYFFIFAWHFDPMIRGLLVYIPKSQRERVTHLVKRFDTAVGNFFRDRIIIAFILGIFFSIGWGIAGVPYALLLGMITGILNFVPFASAVGWPIAVLLTYLDVQASGDGQSYSMIYFWWAVGGAPTLVFLIGQFLEGWVLVPWFMSQSSDLSVVEVIIVVMVGGSVGGLYGLLLAIPIASCMKIVFTDVVLAELEQWAKRN